MQSFSWIPELVATGFLGFSVAIMFFAYRLLTDLVASENPGSLAIFRQKSRAIIFFLSLSATVLLLGIVFAFFKPVPGMNVKFEILPKHVEWGGVELIAQQGRIILYDPERIDWEPEIHFVENERVVLNFHKVLNKIVNMERDLERLAKKLEGTEVSAKAAVNADFIAPNKEDSF